MRDVAAVKDGGELRRGRRRKVGARTATAEPVGWRWRAVMAKPPSAPGLGAQRLRWSRPRTGRAAPSEHRVETERIWPAPRRCSPPPASTVDRDAGDGGGDVAGEDAEGNPTLAQRVETNVQSTTTAEQVTDAWPVPRAVLDECDNRAAEGADDQGADRDAEHDQGQREVTTQQQRGAVERTAPPSTRARCPNGRSPAAISIRR